MTKLEIVKRKSEHVEISLKYNVRGTLSALFEDVFLIHNAIPELDYDDIDTSINFLGYKFNAPIFITGMTGGYVEAKRINSIIARVVEEMGLGMGVGSQRAGLRNPELIETYRIARKKAPTIFLVGNIGATQVIRGSYKDIEMLIDMIDADALAVHLNALQECIQPEGEPFFKGFLTKMKKIKEKIDKPIIIKETGCGFSRENILNIVDIGIDAIDIGGAGGTSFAIIESIRAEKCKNFLRRDLGKLFSNWGIPTAASILEVRSVSSIPLIASGGIRNGLTIAKALILGADLVGIGLPVLRAIENKGEEGLKYMLTRMIEELKTTMFLLGVRSVNELKRSKRYIILGRLREWIKERGIRIR